MKERVCVFGLWHLGCVTAAGLAAKGFQVTGLDLDDQVIGGLRSAQPPVYEPGLAEIIGQGLAGGSLCFTADPRQALAAATVLWVTFDTPVNEDDRADVAWLRRQLAQVRRFVQPGTLVIVSSQVPVGFTAELEGRWTKRDPSLQFASSPENLRLGRAVAIFLSAGTRVVGVRSEAERKRVAPLVNPISKHVEWMSPEAAEMTKHAINAFLATCVAYGNELARLCEGVGVDAAEVERGLRGDERVGREAYVTPGAAFAGGTLARDVTLLGALARRTGVKSPLIGAIRRSNKLHAHWVEDRVMDLVAGLRNPRVALLGLTYKAGTSTLRRSLAVELAKRLADRGLTVRAFDPAVSHAPLDGLTLAESMEQALDRADVAVVATGWAEFRRLTADDFASRMRHGRIVDQGGYLRHLESDSRLIYLRAGQPQRRARA